MKRPVPALSVLDAMPFGKYRGQIVGTVIEEDAEYVAWLLRETENFDLDEDALRYLESCR